MKRFSLLPLLCFAALLAYGCYAAVIVGHWPYYSHPDPKSLPYRALHSIAAITMLTGILSVVFIPFGYAAWRLFKEVKQRPVSPHRIWLILYLAGAAFWIIDIASVETTIIWPSLISWILD